MTAPGDGSRLQQVVLASAAEHNVLPLTSVCNVRCLFCSHQHGPEGLDVYRLSPRHGELVFAALEFLRPDRKVVLGESATRVIEGEPLTHPQFLDIFSALRTRLPDTLIQLTTNGTLLTGPVLDRLAAAPPVAISLSLNAGTAALRSSLMADRHPEVALSAPARLAERGIPFEVSLVALPGLLDGEPLEQTVALAASAGAQRVKVYLAGCSAGVLQQRGWSFAAEDLDELSEQVAALRRRYPVPLTTQPPRLKTLAAEVVGLLPGSPAQAAGVTVGDVVTHVCDQRVHSRSHAHQLLAGQQVETVTLHREGGQRTVSLPCHPGRPVGLIFDDDLPLSRLGALQAVLQSPQPGPLVVLTSTLAFPLIQHVVTQTGNAGETTVLAVPSRTFGGTVGCTGLMTVEDCLHALQANGIDRTRCQRLLLPTEPFDERGLDLLGRSYLDLGELLGVEVRLL